MKTTRIAHWSVQATFVITVIAIRLIGMHLLSPFDDSFIILRHAHNLAMGVGFQFNSGEPILGVSCPLFGLFESLLFLAGFPMPEGVVAMNILIDIGILILGINLLSEHYGVFSAIVFAFLFSISPSLTRITVGNMEVNAFALITLYTIVLYFDRKIWLSIVLASISFFIRPESAILLLIILAIEFFQHSKPRALILALLSLLIVAIGLSSLYLEYHELLPHSVNTKLGWKTSSYLSPFWNLYFNDGLGIALFPFMVVGIISTLKQKIKFSVLALFSIAVTVSYCVFRAATMPWYGELTHLSETMFASIGIALLLKRITKLDRFETKSLLSAGLASVAILSWLVAYLIVGESKVNAKIYAPLKQWGNRENLRSCSIVATDIGALGYYTDSRILDLDGLVCRIKHFNDSELETFIKLEQPDYLFLMHDRHMHLFTQRQFIAEHYSIHKTFFKSLSDSLKYSNLIEWNQNYVLFKRGRNP